MKTLKSYLRILIVSMIFIGSVEAEPQAVAPVSHDRHEHPHNSDHPTEPADSDRFHTSREGAALDLPAEDGVFSFVVFGDRTGGPNEGVDILAQAVADTNLIEPDLVMTVGDLIDGYNQTPAWMQQMRQYKEVMGELICPWFPVAGNHDVYWRGPDKPQGEHEASYELHFGPLWYAFEHKGCFFIALYSDEGDPETGIKTFRNPASQRMSAAQFDWLKSILDKAKDAEHVFIFIHHPRWLGRGYGSDWDRVHAELVDAGNVSGVFAGHIHHMRYDPRDGIDYFSLATVGGHQSGWSPQAGWLHHFNLVTVREGQVAFAAFPVGGVIDPKAITAETSEQSEVLGRSQPVTFETPLTINDDGSVDDELTVIVKNPSELTIDVEVIPGSADSRWSIGPDHRHAQIAAGGEQSFSFRVTRPAGRFDITARAIVVELRIDMLTERLRFAIPVKRVMVPGSLVLSE